MILLGGQRPPTGEGAVWLEETQETLVSVCGALNKNGPYRIRYLNA